MAYAVYGAGGFAREVAPVLRRLWLETEAMMDINETAPDIVFVDDSENRATSINGMPVLDFQALTSDAHRHRKVVVAIGSGETRKKIEGKCSDAGLRLASAVSHTAIVMDEVHLGDGAVVCDHAIITSNVRIGRSFQANLYSYVAHDCIIGDYVTFAPRVSCNGNVHIGDGAYVGTGVMIIQGSSSEPMTIGAGAIVGMGSVVTKPVEPNTLVVGNPARMVRRLGE